ncbi:MAG: hypothetical protein KDA71_07860, partial [Planctomycetales bacterium]|nr:hypothetical protein [Planctomycetales bacterium]
MSTNPESVTVLPTHWSLAELQDHLGGIAPSRIRLFPPPGTANVDDVARSFEGSKGRCELIDGVLVEKDVGYYESIVAMIVARLLGNF